MRTTGRAPLKRSLFLLAFALARIGAAGADDLDSARSLEREGKAAQALATYEKWLDSHQSDDRWQKVLLHAADVAESPQAEIDLLASRLAVAGAARHGALLRLAQANELVGNLQAAQIDFEKASIASGDKDFRSLLESARLLFELGQIDKAVSEADAITELCGSRRILLATRAFLAMIRGSEGRAEDAGGLLSSLLRSKDSLSAADLLLAYRAALSAGLSDDAESCLEELSARFPRSPEYAIASRRLSPVPSPAQLPFGVGAEPPAQAAEAPQGPRPESSSGQAVLVQVGSFWDRHNATDRLNGLSAAGFRGEIRPVVEAGETFYRVVAESSGEAQQFLDRLKASGFLGYIVPE